MISSIINIKNMINLFSACVHTHIYNIHIHILYIPTNLQNAVHVIEIAFRTLICLLLPVCRIVVFY